MSKKNTLNCLYKPGFYGITVTVPIGSYWTGWECERGRSGVGYEGLQMLTNALMLVVVWCSGAAGRGAPVRGVRQAAVHAAHAEEAHRAAAPAAAALSALQPLPQGLPDPQLAQQPQEHLPPSPARRAAADTATEPHNQPRHQDQPAASQHRLLQVQRSV